MFKCIECNREFSSQQSLDDHNKSKHFIKLNDKKGSSFFKNKYLWITIGIIVLFFVLLSTPAIDISPGKYDSFAECLSGKGFKMYGAYWCSHCADQKKLFGNSFSKINYVECSLPNNAGQTEDCKNSGINSYPTWEFGDGTKQEGLISLNKLSEISGCVLP